jgi:hypothetical protein
MTLWRRAAAWHARYFPNENFGQTIADNIARDNGVVEAHRGPFLTAPETKKNLPVALLLHKILSLNN